jgi:hypothetical protein
MFQFYSFLFHFIALLCASMHYSFLCFITSCVSIFLLLCCCSLCFITIPCFIAPTSSLFSALLFAIVFVSLLFYALLFLLLCCCVVLCWSYCFVTIWCFTTPLCFTIILPSQVRFCPLVFCCSFVFHYCLVFIILLPRLVPPHCFNNVEIWNYLGGRLKASKLPIKFLLFFFWFSFLDLFLGFYFISFFHYFTWF